MMGGYERPVVDPITGLCIVAAKQACPVGYKVLDKCYDQQQDADLWKDSFLTKKERYLCVTRYFPLDNGRLNNVVDSIALIQDKDLAPPGFAVVEFTFDTNEKAMKKKFLAVKMVPRFSVQEAVCDIIVLARMKKPPEDYVLFGEVSGMLLCYQRGPVPPEVVKPVEAPYPTPYILQQSDITGARPPKADQNNGNKRIEPTGTVQLKSPSVNTQTGASLARQTSRSLRLNSVTQTSVIDDVPFKLNGAYAVVSPSGRRAAPIPHVTYLSLNEIELQYHFDFSVAKNFIANCRRENGQR